MDTVSKTVGEWTDALLGKVNARLPLRKTVPREVCINLEHMAVVIHYQISKILFSWEDADEFAFYIHENPIEDADEHVRESRLEFYRRSALSLSAIHSKKQDTNYILGQIHAFAESAHSVLEIFQKEEMLKRANIREMMNEKVTLGLAEEDESQ